MNKKKGTHKRRGIKNDIFVITCGIIILIGVFLLSYVLVKSEETWSKNYNELREQDDKKQETIEELNKKIEELQKEQEKVKKEQKDLKTTVNKIKVSKERAKTITTRSNSSSPRVSLAKGTKGEYQKYAKSICLEKYCWTENDFNCLVLLWNRESGWNPNAHNSNSGAHGIAQALPASKMASEGSDYLTNYKTQINWGLKYIKNRYSTPSKAWSHFQNKNWY